MPFSQHDQDLTERVRRCNALNEIYLDDGAGAALTALPFPRYFLHSEKLSTPCGKPAYRWSCLVQTEQYAFAKALLLPETPAALSANLADAVVSTLTARGTLFVYTVVQETAPLMEVGKAFPELAPVVEAICARMVALRPLALQSYYHPRMRGSWSIDALGLCLPDRRPFGAAAGMDAQALRPSFVMERLVELLCECKQWRYLLASRLTSDTTAGSLVFDLALIYLKRRLAETEDHVLTGPVSWLQRHLKLGYGATLDLVNVLEQKGVLSPVQYRTCIGHGEKNAQS